MIGHELTALHGIDHARTLAVVMPSLLEVQRAKKRAKLVQFAGRVWEIEEGSDTARVAAAIARTREFYESLGLPTRLKAYNLGAETASEVAGRLRERGMLAIGERGDITPEVVERILREAA
jgi:NADP-dependent alcohol dehydrogenase